MKYVKVFLPPMGGPNFEKGPVFEFTDTITREQVVLFISNNRQSFPDGTFGSIHEFEELTQTDQILVLKKQLEQAKKDIAAWQKRFSRPSKGFSKVQRFPNGDLALVPQ